MYIFYENRIIECIRHVIIIHDIIIPGYEKFLLEIFEPPTSLYALTVILNGEHSLGRLSCVMFSQFPTILLNTLAPTKSVMLIS